MFKQLALLGLLIMIPVIGMIYDDEDSPLLIGTLRLSDKHTPLILKSSASLKDVAKDKIKTKSEKERSCSSFLVFLLEQYAHANPKYRF